MRVAMTGSTGLIGSALAARLEAGGHEVARIRRGGEDEPGADWDPAGGCARRSPPLPCRPLSMATTWRTTTSR